jgi:DNA-binding response OmpR family regulator
LILNDSLAILLHQEVQRMQEMDDFCWAQPGQTVVLIAEDEPRVSEFARNVLQADGYFVLSARDGQEALSASRQYPGTIHALLADLSTPGLDGLELRRKILMERPQIRVLLMSGAFQNPGDDIPFLAKPFTSNDLKQRMRKLFAFAAMAR